MNRRGMFYVVALSTLALLLATGATMLTRGFLHAQQSKRFSNRYASVYLAEAAVDQAIQHLTVSNTANILSTTMPTGTFWAEMTALGNSTYTVTAHGLAGSEQENVEAVVRVAPRSVFQFAVFGTQSVTVGGSSITDSFDSRLGSYASQTPGAKGNVGTNATTPGGVTVSGGIAINGQIAVGPNVSPPESVVAGLDSVVVTGSPKVLSQSSTFETPAVTVPTGMACNDYTVQGNSTVTLSSAVGTYCFKDLTVQGGGTLTANGPVKVYLTGELRASGNTVVGVAANPTAMKVLVASTGGATLEGTLTGSTQFYGALYGPQANIQITGHAQVYGSIIANSVSLSGSAELHYDQADSQLTDATSGYTATVLSWRELG